MFGWLRALKTQKNSEVHDDDCDDYVPPSITFYLENGVIKAVCEWPPPNDDEQKTAIINDMTMMLFLVNGGYLYPMIQQAIGVAGDALGMDSIAQALLSALNQARDKSLRSKIMEGNDEELVVDPEDAFRPIPADAVQ